MPAAIAHLLAADGQIAGQFQNQGPGHLHHGGLAVAPGVVEANAQVAASGLIHLVGAGAGGADQAQLGQLVEQVSIQSNLVGDRDLGVDQPFKALLVLGAGPAGEEGLLLQGRKVHGAQAQGVKEDGPGLFHGFGLSHGAGLLVHDGAPSQLPLLLRTREVVWWLLELQLVCHPPLAAMG